VYLLLAMSEIFASVAALEYAFTKAPTNMRSLVMSVYFIAKAVGVLLAMALKSLNEDPLLVWNYGSSSIVALVTAVLFWLSHRALDKEEDMLNILPAGQLKKKGDVEVAESNKVVELADSSRPVELEDCASPVELSSSGPVELATCSSPVELEDSGIPVELPDNSTPVRVDVKHL
jgi:hypothetical protein